MIHFLMFLQAKGLPACIYPGLQIKRSLGMQRGKSDKVDTRRISYYGFLIRHKLTPTELPAQNIARLKQLFGVRALLVKHRTALKNNLHAQKIASKLTESKFVVDMLKAEIKHKDELIAKAEKEMKNIITSCLSLKANYNLLLSVSGVGPVIATLLIIYTNNFESFQDARQFMCYTGVAPFDHGSGTFKAKSKVSELGNRKVKTLLLSGVRSAIQYNAEIRSYYERKIAQGKSPGQAANAAVGKMILQVFAVIKRRTPFVVLYSDNFAKKSVA